MHPLLDPRWAWFSENAGQIVDWGRVSDPALRLASAPKGIYKPSDSKYALSIRVMMKSKYSDGRVLDEGGEWYLSYHQEGEGRRDRSREYTNVALRSSMDDGIPIGVLIELQPRLGRVRYRVQGLAGVENWEGDHIILRGPASTPDSAQHAGATMPARFQEHSDGHDFVPSELDARLRVEKSIVTRQGQATLRRQVLSEHGYTCVISGCTEEATLDAAHINPYRGDHSNSPANGILLRADLHTLFDRHLIGIEPTTGRLYISKQVVDPTYTTLAGTVVLEGTARERREVALTHAWTRFQELEDDREPRRPIS